MPTMFISIIQLLTVKDTAKCAYCTPDDQQQSDPEDLNAMNFGLHLIGEDGLDKHIQWAHPEGEHSSTDVCSEKGCFLRSTKKNQWQKLTTHGQYAVLTAQGRSFKRTFSEWIISSNYYKTKLSHCFRCQQGKRLFFFKLSNKVCMWAPIRSQILF